jgi:hypothetical protein
MSIAFLGFSPSLNANVKNSFFYDSWRENQSMRFAVSGILGNTIFYGLDKVLLPVIEHTSNRSSASNNRAVVLGSKWISDNAASVSFFVAYLLDIAVQRKRACSYSTLISLSAHILIPALLFHYFIR